MMGRAIFGWVEYCSVGSLVWEYFGRWVGEKLLVVWVDLGIQVGGY